MAELTATFETGADGATISTGDAGSATAWDSVTGSPTYSNTHAYDTLSMLTNADNEYCLWSTTLGNVTDHYGRAYLYLEAFPSGGTSVFQPVRIYRSGSLAATAVFINSTGKLQIGSSNAGLGTSTTSVSVNQWIRTEWHVIHSATVGFVEVKLFNDPDSTTPTETLTSDSDNNTLVDANQIRVGRDSGGAGGNVWVDNVVVNATSYPGPAVAPAAGQLVGQFDPHVSSKAWF